MREAVAQAGGLETTAAPPSKRSQDPFTGELAQFGIGNRMRYMVFDGEPQPLVVEMFVNPGEKFDAEVPELEKLLKGTTVAG